MWRKHRQAARYVLTFMLFCSLVMIVVGARDQRRGYVAVSSYVKTIDRARDSGGRIPVFVNEPAIHEPLF